MALTTADYYWVDAFTLIQQQTDREIEAFNASPTLHLFASPLVEPQRFTNDLLRSTQKRVENVGLQQDFIRENGLID